MLDTIVVAITRSATCHLQACYGDASDPNAFRMASAGDDNVVRVWRPRFRPHDSDATETQHGSAVPTVTRGPLVLPPVPVTPEPLVEPTSVPSIASPAAVAAPSATIRTGSGGIGDPFGQQRRSSPQPTMPRSATPTAACPMRSLRTYYETARQSLFNDDEPDPAVSV